MNGIKSHWQLVTSNIPQRSVLGPDLFNVFIKYSFSNFTDETKLGKIIDLQKNLDKLDQCAVSSQVMFNKVGCQVLLGS